MDSHTGLLRVWHNGIIMEKASPPAEPSLFDDARQALITMTRASALIVPPKPVQAWLRLAEAAKAVVGPNGESHLAALLENAYGAHIHVAHGIRTVVEDLDLIAHASRRAGWRGADTPRAFAAAVATGEVPIMDKVASLEGAPPPEAWGSLVAPVLDAEGNFTDESRRLPAPQVWAAERDAEAFQLKALAWWLARGGPVPEAICESATPASLPLLLAAGAPCTAATAVHWLDVAAGGGTLCLDDVADMLDQLTRVRPSSPAVQRLRTAIPGCRLIEEMGTVQFNDDQLARRIDAWRQACALPPDAPLPLLPLAPGRTSAAAKLSLGIQSPEMPWWAEALLVSANAWGQHPNAVALLTPRVWEKAAGNQCTLPPSIQPHHREILLGFVLLMAWSTADVSASSTDRVCDVSAFGALHAGDFAANIMKWAGLDGPSARRCMASTLDVLGSSVSDAFDARLRRAVHAAVFEALLSDTEEELLAPASVGHLVVHGDPVGFVDTACTHSVLEWMTGRFAFAARPPPSPQAVLLVGLSVLAAIHVPPATPADPTTYNRDARQLAEILADKVQSGHCVDPALLPAAVAEEPATRALFAANALAFGAPSHVQLKKQRRRG